MADSATAGAQSGANASDSRRPSSLDMLLRQFKWTLWLAYGFAYLFTGALALLDQANVLRLRDVPDSRIVTSSVVEVLLAITAIPVVIISILLVRAVFVPQGKAIAAD